MILQSMTNKWLSSVYYQLTVQELLDWFISKQNIFKMERPKKSVGLSYFMPGIVLLFVIGILFLILLCIPIYIYVTTTLVALLLHRLFFKKAVLHPWHLSPEEIEDSKRISVCVVGAGFSGLCMAIKLKKAGINFRFDFNRIFKIKKIKLLSLFI